MRDEMFTVRKLMPLHVLACIFIIATGLLSGCAEKKSDEAMIQEQIEFLQEAIETHDRGKFMAIIDAQYHDQLNKDRKSLQRMLLAFFLRYKDISVYVSASQFDIRPIRAEVQSQIVVTGGKGLFPENARHYQLTSCWKKNSGAWLLSCLEWQ